MSFLDNYICIDNITLVGIKTPYLIRFAKHKIWQISVMPTRHDFTAICVTFFNNRNTDDWQAERRYQTLVHFLDAQAPKLSVEKAMGLLSGEYGFLCQYDRSTGKDTLWSVLYDLKDKRIYRTEKNPCRTTFKADRRFHF